MSRKKKSRPRQLDVSPEDIQIIEFGEGRYAVANKNTGEIIDDAQGWGYKTRQNAHKAVYYKLNKNKIDSENATVKNFLKNNKAFSDEIETCMWYAVKDNEEFTVDSFKTLVEEMKIELPMDADKFFKILMRKSFKW